MRIKNKFDLEYIQPENIVEIVDLNLGFIEIPFNITLIVGGRSNVRLESVRKLQVSGNSYVRVDGRTVATLQDEAEGAFFNEARVALGGRARAKLFGSEASLYDESFAYFQGGSALMFGRSSAVLFGFARASLKDESSAILREKSFATLFDKSSATLYDWSSCDLVSSDAKVKSYGQSKVQRKTFKPRTKKEWLKWLNLKVKDDCVYLYKWVDKDYKDFFSGAIDYSQEKVIAPDWVPGFPFECGEGLHLAADPWTAYSFYPMHEGRMLKFKVPLKDLYPYLKADCRYPFKVRVPRLQKFVAELYLDHNQWIEEVKDGSKRN